jgi:hypothetical protein
LQIQKPQNDKLRGRLLELLIEQGRGGEVEQMVAAVEMDKLHCESRHWYSTILRLCKVLSHIKQYLFGVAVRQ